MSVVFHEVAHGFVAKWSGDHTAELQGRLTLNPLRHIDPVFSILLPILLLWSTGGRMMFGGARPVPVNIHNFRSLKRDYFLVSAAGVTTNFLLALFLGLLLYLPFIKDGSVAQIVLFGGVYFNLILCFFNLIPVPPLDGSRMLRVFLPSPLVKLFNFLDHFGIFLLIALIIFAPGLLMLFLQIGTGIAFGILNLEPTEVNRMFYQLTEAMSVLFR